MPTHYDRNDVLFFGFTFPSTFSFSLMLNSPNSWKESALETQKEKDSNPSISCMLFHGISEGFQLRNLGSDPTFEFSRIDFLMTGVRCIRRTAGSESRIHGHLSFHNSESAAEAVENNPKIPSSERTCDLDLESS